MADHDRDSAASASDSDTAAPTLASRHRAEWKQLRATIQALKRSAGKGDKKRKREVAVEIARLEKEMEERHAREVAEEQSGAKADAVGAIVDAMAAVGVNGDADETTAVDAPAPTVATTGGTGKKPNRQQLRKVCVQHCKCVMTLLITTSLIATQTSRT